MKTAGICLGSTRISMALIEKAVNGTISIAKTLTKNHEGKVLDILNTLFLDDQFKRIEKVGLTGRKLRHMVKLDSISEAEAIETAYGFLKHKYPNCDTVVSAGGEAFLAYTLNKNGNITNVHTGNKCASGTGDFFLQQIKRMGLDIDQSLNIADKDNPYNVANRCSVFCKSDCTHALNKGEAKGKVVAGLCKMMAGKILELINKCKGHKILLIGGATQNSVMVHYIHEQLAPGQTLCIADEAEYFEALGSALWAIKKGNTLGSGTGFFAKTDDQSSFSFLPSLRNYLPNVTFQSLPSALAREQDECIVGLDVGSTTTKAVVLRTSDNSILASVYLRTNGDPVSASRQCYQMLDAKLPVSVNIIGLGVTGSGRQIAGLHAGTKGIVNEILAHATAAVHFDPEVDTIFEIGGQDAKYTYIINGVPADYAMNEACSAGTGSFLEEAAKESMGIDTKDIADIAFRGDNPPNFNDQCAAFIGSDIKNAIHEGIAREDIAAGLVYSICQNYINRVKGNRAIGKKIFMQGGVCYNKAVPVAMAALTNQKIIVPPEPGLMGAFGVALVIKDKIRLGLLDKQPFNLKDLAARKTKQGQSFVCNGGKEQCDRKCLINVVEIENIKYPFGGACNKYVNLRNNIRYDVEKLDYVAVREKLIFEKYTEPLSNSTGHKKIGLAKSLLTNALYPLYQTFFTKLGFEVVLGSSINPKGIEQAGAAFCYPVEQSHGFIADLMTKDVDYIFLPHIVGVPVHNGIKTSVACPLVQAEPYYLNTSFPELSQKKVISPILDFSGGYDLLTDDFIKIGEMLSVYDKKLCLDAYRQAVQKLKACQAEMKQLGRDIIAELEKNPDKVGLVLFGRSYNAFSKHANMGIPSKAASRGYVIFPWEFLPYENEGPIEHMFWSMGQMVLKSAKYVKEHPRLFGVYITNFSCGPDSFILGQFRDIMGKKPSLTLELDSHTADAGIDTRIEAFLDIVNSYRQVENKTSPQSVNTVNHFSQAYTTIERNKLYIVDSFQRRHRLTDPSVEVIVPSMGSIASRLFAASLRYVGINATHLAPATKAELAVGRANASCKECLPYLLVTGSILNDLEVRRQKESPDKILVYFVADSSGPCRFGQYHIAIRNLISQKRIPNVALISLSSDNGYAGLGTKFQTRAWQAIVIADVLSDIYSALLVLAQDQNYALERFEEAIKSIETAIATQPWKAVRQILEQQVKLLAVLPTKTSLHMAPKAALIGEIFVRADGLARQYLVEKLANQGIITKVAPISEFIYFCDYILQKSYYHVPATFTDKISSKISGYFKRRYEADIKNILAKSGFYEAHLIDIEKLTIPVEHLIPARYTAGETTLTVASALNDIVDKVDGVIAIGPFGCMPGRVAEAILSKSINDEKKMVTADKSLLNEVMTKHPSLPFLAVESDGSPFPQLIESKFEIFCLQVQRLHQTIAQLNQTY